MLKHKFILLCFIQQIVLFQFYLQFGKQWNKPLPMFFVLFCFGRTHQKSAFRPVNVRPA